MNNYQKNSDTYSILSFKPILKQHIMKKQLLFLFGSLLLFSNSSTAQNNNWRSSILQENANYYDIVAENEARLLPIRSLTDRRSKKQVKQFDRWAAFWKDRVLADGSFISAAHTYNA